MKNTLTRRLCALLACLLLLAALTACGTRGDDADDGDGAETEIDLTSLPRFNYLSEDTLSLLKLDPADYAAMTLYLPSTLQITDEDVEISIYAMQLEFREPVTAAESDTETGTETDDDSKADATDTETGSETGSETETDDGVIKMTDRPMEKGDSAFIYYRGEIDGEEFEGGSNWSSNIPEELILGSNDFIDGFEDALIGIIPAQTSRDNPAKINVTFPEDYGYEDLNGKDAVIYVYVEYAVEYDVPALDFDFVWNELGYEKEAERAKEEYADEEELLTEFRAFIRKGLEEDVAETIEEAKVASLWYYLMDKAEFISYPEDEMTYYTAYYENQITSAYNYYANLSGTSFTDAYPTKGDFAVKYYGLDEDWRAALRSMAEELVERDMLAHAVAEQQGLETVSDEEFDKEIQTWIDYYKENGNITKTREDIIEQVGGEDNIRMLVVKTKTEAWLLERATFEYKS